VTWWQIALIVLGVVVWFIGWLLIAVEGAREDARKMGRKVNADDIAENSTLALFWPLIALAVVVLGPPVLVIMAPVKFAEWFANRPDRPQVKVSREDRKRLAAEQRRIAFDAEIARMEKEAGL